MKIEEDEKVAMALRGEVLYGDDFTDDEIARWFEDEREGYFNLGHAASSKGKDDGHYAYEQLAQQHGFKWLPERAFESVLGIGSAHGAELKPLLQRGRQVVVLEPSDGYTSEVVDGKPVTYVKPSASGIMPFPDQTFDIVVCFSVLHHIPNVSVVLREAARVLRPGGFALLREPTHSMGDWRAPRRGLTLRERGIPLAIFRSIISRSGFQVIKETRCMFSLMSRLSPLARNGAVWATPSLVTLDRWICSLPIWPSQYGAQRWWYKIRPTAVAYVLRRPD